MNPNSVPFPAHDERPTTPTATAPVTTSERTSERRTITWPTGCTRTANTTSAILGPLTWSCLRERDHAGLCRPSLDLPVSTTPTVPTAHGATTKRSTTP